MKTRRCEAARRRLERGAALLAACLLAAPAGAFGLFPQRLVYAGSSIDVRATLERGARWSSLSGLDDGIQVGVAPGFAEALGATSPEQVARVHQALRAAFAAWESPVLRFELHFDAVDAAEGPDAGHEIDLFAVPDTHPVFLGTTFFGLTYLSEHWSAARPLTNGASTPGYVIEGADIFVNAPLASWIAAIFLFSEQQELDALQRLVMHETGHALGLGHANSNDPYGPGTNFDSDFEPRNELVIDGLDPFAGLLVSPARDDQAILSNRPCGEPFPGPCPALFFTALQADDRGGRDVLYPNPRLCGDGIDNDADGLADALDPGCDAADDPSERSAALACDNGVDDDHDGAADHPADPGCGDPAAPREDPQCQDGVDNRDADLFIDFDGGLSIYGVALTDPDPECQGMPWRRESARSCGLGFELALALSLPAALRRRRRGRRRLLEAP